MQEHWKLGKDGQIAGVWGLDLSKATGDRWSKIDQVITEWTKLHPQEMLAHLKMVKELNAQQKNEFAASDSKSLRYAVEIPTGLGIQLNLLDPELFSNKTLLGRFAKRYRGFAVCTRV